MLRNIIASSLAVLLMSGCWTMQQAKMANFAKRPSIQLCLMSAGLDPQQVDACIMYSQNTTDVKTCETNLLKTEEQRDTLHRCVLEYAATVKTTNCYRGFWGDYTCTSASN